MPEARNDGTGVSLEVNVSHTWWRFGLAEREYLQLVILSYAAKATMLVR